MLNSDLWFVYTLKCLGKMIVRETIFLMNFYEMALMFLVGC